MTTKQKFLSTCHLRRLIHTQMAHGKKSWFCSHVSSLFFIFLHFSLCFFIFFTFLNVSSFSSFFFMFFTFLHVSSFSSFFNIVETNEEKLLQNQDFFPCAICVCIPFMNLWNLNYRKMSLCNIFNFQSCSIM